MFLSLEGERGNDDFLPTTAGEKARDADHEWDRSVFTEA